MAKKRLPLDSVLDQNVAPTRICLCSSQIRTHVQPTVQPYTCSTNYEAA